MKKIRTKGNVLVNKIEIGDIHYEYEYGMCVESQVITKPVRDEDGLWTWESRNLETGKIINYAQHEDYPHYGVNLYDYQAYKSIRGMKTENRKEE